MHGVQGHVAYPQLAENPVHTFAPALAELTSRVWDQGTEHFQPTTLPDFQLQCRHRCAECDPRRAQGALQPALLTRTDAGASQGDGRRHPAKHGVRYTIEWYVSGEPFYTAPGAFSEAVGAAIEEVTGARPKISTGGGTSDGRFIAPLGAQVVELGVVNATIHKVNESVRVEEIDTLHQMYFNVLRNTSCA